MNRIVSASLLFGVLCFIGVPLLVLAFPRGTVLVLLACVALYSMRTESQS